MKKSLILMAVALLSVPSHSMEALEKPADKDIIHIVVSSSKAICAEGLAGTLEISKASFEKMNTYFPEIDKLRRTDIPYDMDLETFVNTVRFKSTVLVAMNDSCLARADSGVALITVDGLQDCVGILMYHPEVGSAGAHIALGTKLTSLDRLIEPFKGKKGGNVTLISSWKTTRLKMVFNLLKKNDIQVDQIFVNNVVQQMSASGLTLKRYFNPDDFPAQKKAFLKLTKACQKGPLKQLPSDLGERLGSENYGSPYGAVLDTSTGKVSFINHPKHGKAPEVSSSAIARLRGFVVQDRPQQFSSLRYLQHVKSLEHAKEVDIPFIEYTKERGPVTDEELKSFQENK